jgi:S-disulfanyl-L-cysteine oxidoreductase SoxD
MRLRRQQGLAGASSGGRPLSAGFVSIWLTAVVSAGVLPGQQPAAPAAPSIWSGVYSPAQARRGLLEYARSCEHCHGSNLTGDAIDEVPALVADAFLFHWRGRTVQDLYARLSKAMPADAPGSLSANAYLDLVAYLLEANGYPAGAQDLERERLGALTIEKALTRKP